MLKKGEIVEKKPRRPLVAHRHDLEDFDDVPYTPLKPLAETLEPNMGASEEPTTRLSFTGKRGALFSIALVNALLTILTLGIYRFWAKTRLRRYFWSNIRIQNEPLEYTGTAMELFIGFLVVLAILVPLFAIYQGALFLAQSSPEWITTSLNVFYGIALLAFFQYAFYRMWRYRFSRTTWRGIRFQQDGSALKYLGITLVWMFVCIITLGLAYPWMRNAQWAYRLNNLEFGKSKFRFRGKAKDLLHFWLIVWAIVFVPIIVSSVYHVELLAEINNLSAASGKYGKNQIFGFSRELFYYVLAYLVSLLFAGGLFIWYRVKAGKYYISMTQLQSVSFTAHLRTFPILGSLALAGLTSLIIIFGLLVGISGTVTISLAGPEASQEDMIAMGELVGLTFSLVLIFVLLPLVGTVILDFNVVRHIFSNISLSNLDALSHALQADNQIPKTGEGLADALDVGAF